MESYTVTSTLGLLELTPTDANHIAVSSPRNSVISFRGVDYCVHLHLYLWSDGLFHIGQETDSASLRRSSFYATRPFTGSKQDGTRASESARLRIGDALAAAVQFFVKSCPEALTLAQRVSLQDKVEAAERDYAEAMEKADAALKVRNAAQETYRQFLLAQDAPKWAEAPWSRFALQWAEIIASELWIEVPDESESLTTEKLAERAIAEIEKMTAEEKAVVRKYLNGGSK